MYAGEIFVFTTVKVFILVWQSFKDLFLKQLDSAKIDFLWTDKEEIRGVVSRVSSTIEQETQIAKQALAYAFDGGSDVPVHTQKTLEFIEEYLQDSRQLLSLPAMCLAAFDLFGGFEGKHNLTHPVLAAAVFGEIHNDLDYHNNAHYKKVLLHTIRLIAAHNRMFSGRGAALKPEQISQMLATACAHDIGHEAKGNFVDRKYVFASQEQKSYGYVSPFLSFMGYTSGQCEEVRIMFLTTDVTPFGDISSPSNQLRMAYEMHFGTSDYDDNMTLCEPLRILEEDSRLCLMCMLLHEADILNSAGLDYKTTIGESIRISREIGKTSATPEDTYMFLKMICHDRMNTDAAQFLASENMQKISTRVHEDIKNGVNFYEMSNV